MNYNLSKKQLKRYSRQIILKNIGPLGQKKIIQSKVLIIGMGGLGCPVAEFLTRAGVGSLGIVDFDKVDLSNIHRQSLYDIDDIKKSKVIAAKEKLNRINSQTKVNSYNLRLNKKNQNRILNNYEYIVDGSDNFETKLLINEFCKKNKKFLVVGAISKFDGQIFTFDFKKKNTPCIRSFYQENTLSDDILNCEFSGILGTIAGTIGTLQSNEILKSILGIGRSLNGHILIVDLLNFNFRKVKYNKLKKFSK